jgi:ribosomal-protein-alanine N-acetyltransferase
MVETDRLVIRLADMEDVPEIVRYYKSNWDYLQAFSPLFSPELLDEIAWVEQVAVRVNEFTHGETFRAFLFPRDEPRRIVGNINLTHVVRGAMQSCVLGYNLDEARQGRGYMTEAVRAVVQFAFMTWGLHRVAAAYMPRNERSAAVLERCGFRIEGRASSYLQINGRWEDHVLTSIVNPDVAGPGRSDTPAVEA